MTVKQNRTVTQDLAGKGVQRRLGVSAGEFCDDHHTALPFLLLALAPLLGPHLFQLLADHDPPILR